MSTTPPQEFLGSRHRVRLPMPRVTLLVAGSALVLGGLTYGVLRASQPPPPAPYVTVPVKRERVTLTYTATGEVEPATVATFTLPDPAATVSSVAVTVGEQVTAGQLLAQLSDPNLNSQLANAETALQKAQAALAAAENPSARAAAAAAIHEAQSNVALAQDTLQNDEALLASLTVHAVTSGPVRVLVAAGQSVSPGQPVASQGSVTYTSPVAGTIGQVSVASGVNIAPSTVLMQISDPTLAIKVEQDQEQLAAAQAALDQALVDNSPSALNATIQEDQATVQADQASVQALTSQVQALTIRAPFAGLVTTVNSQPGSVNQPIVAVAGEVRTVSVPIPETAVMSLHVGQPVLVSLPADPGHRFAGTLSVIDPVAQYANGIASFTVTVTLNHWPNLPYYGVSANVTIVLQSVRHALAVPLAALRTRDGHTVVLVPAGTGTRPVPVRVLLETPTKVAVTSNALHAGQPVVIAVPTAPSGKVSLKTRGRAVHRAGAAGPRGRTKA